MQRRRSRGAIGRRGGIWTIAASLVCFLAAGPWPVLAAEADAPPREAAPEPESEAGVERDKPGDAAPRPEPKEASPDIFVPSEDISEDLSVRFPVDI